MGTIEKYLTKKPLTYLRELVEECLEFEENGVLPRTSSVDKILNELFGKDYEQRRVTYLNMFCKELFKVITKKYFKLN